MKLLLLFVGWILVLLSVASRADVILRTDSSPASGTRALNASLQNLVAASGEGDGREWVTLYRNTSSAIELVKYEVEAHLSPPDETRVAIGFGDSIEFISQDRVVVGAPRVTVDGISGAGALYIFERVGRAWRFSHKMFSSSPTSGEQFGSAIHAMENGVLTFASGGSKVYWSQCVYNVAFCINSTRQISFPELSGYVFGGASVHVANLIAFDIKSVADGTKRVVLLKSTNGPEPFEIGSILQPPPGANGLRFGEALIFNSSVIYVGSPSEVGGAGAIFGYSIGPSTLGAFDTTITNPDPTTEFGSDFSQNEGPVYLVKSNRNGLGAWRAFSYNMPLAVELVVLDFASRSNQVLLPDRFNFRYIVLSSGLSLRHIRINTQTFETAYLGPLEPNIATGAAVDLKLSSSGQLALGGAIASVDASGNWAWESRFLPRSSLNLWLGSQFGTVIQSSPEGIVPGVNIFAPGSNYWLHTQNFLAPDNSTFQSFTAQAIGDASRLFVGGQSGSIYSYSFNCCGLAQWTFRQKTQIPGCSTIVQMSLNENSLGVLCETNRAVYFSASNTAELTTQFPILALPDQFNVRAVIAGAARAATIGAQGNVQFLVRNTNGWGMTSTFNLQNTDGTPIDQLRFNSASEAVAVQRGANGAHAANALFFNYDGSVWNIASRLNCPNRYQLQCFRFPVVASGVYYWEARDQISRLVERIIPGEFQSGFEE